MKRALRTAYWQITGNHLDKLEFEDIEDLPELKKLW